LRISNLLFLAPLLLVSCMRMPEVTRRAELPAGSELAVILFQDCMIPDQEDCTGSGNLAANVFAKVFSQSAKFRAVPLSWPVGPKAPLSDDAAVALAKEKGFKYVINGEVIDFYDVAPMTFRVDRAGVSIRILRVADGSVIAFFTHKKNAGSNFATPSDVVQEMAEHVRDSL